MNNANFKLDKYGAIIIFTIILIFGHQEKILAQCNGIIITNPSSLIPNTSFDQNSCCPDGVTPTGSQMACINYHSQASEATIDYHVVGCGESLDHPCITEVPTGTSSENGILGMVNSDGWKEYLGTCLSSPLTPGVSYSLKFKIGFGNSKGPCVIDGITYLSEAYGPITFGLYGSASCTSLPFAGTGCPTSNWTQLGTATLNGTDQWVEGIITFTVSQTMNAIVFGPDCSPTFGLSGYYYLDDFILNESGIIDPQININPIGHPCSGLTLQGAPTNNAYPYTYQWFFNGNPIQGATSLSYQIPALQEGEYFVRMYLGNQCVESSTYNMVVPSYETYLNEELCFGESIQVGNSTFDQSGSYEELIITSDGCDSTVYLTLLIREELLFDYVDQGEILCAGGTAEVIVNSNATQPIYTWEDGITGSPRQLTAGTHEVFVTDNFGCKSSIYTFTLDEPDSLKVSFLTTDESCVGYNDGTAIPLIEGGTPPYFIKNKDSIEFLSFYDSIAFVDLVPMDYFMIVKDSNECTFEKRFTILEREYVEVNLKPLETIAIGDSAVLCIETNPLIDIDTYFWQGNRIDCDTCNQPTIHPLTPPYNRYVVKITEAEVGCIYYANRDVQIIDGVYIPNIFSPNGDGLNDLFFIQANPESVTIIEEFYIYDRWGEQVFQLNSFSPNDESKSWDGTFHGHNLSKGVYVFFAKIKLVNDEVITKKGSITLIR